MKTDEMCFSTVLGLSTRWWAIARFERPSAMAASTSRSRSLRALERVDAAAAPEQRGDHVGVDHGATFGDVAHRGDEGTRVSDAVLEQVADTARRPLDQVDGVPGLQVMGEDQDPHVGMGLPDPASGVESFDRVRRRHPDVDDDHIGFGVVDQGHELLRAGRLPDDGEAGVREQPRESGTQQRDVVCEHHPGSAHRRASRAGQVDHAGRRRQRGHEPRPTSEGRVELECPTGRFDAVPQARQARAPPPVGAAVSRRR